MDNSLSAERDRSIYFYRLEAPANNPSPAVYLLGGCHVIPITKLPEFVQNIFEKCETFVTECSEIHLPGYFKIHLNNMKELGYAVTPESLVQMEIDSKKMTFGNEEYKKQFCEELLKKYCAGWTTLLEKPNDLKSIIESHGLEIEMINACHPKVVLSGVLRTLIRWEQEKDGMDKHFFTQAFQRRKTVIGLETDLDRANLVCKSCMDTDNLMPLEHLLLLIDEELKNLRNLSLPENKQAIDNEISKATTAYLTKEIEKHLDESVYGVKERNVLWCPKLKDILAKTDKPIFVCVGLNHVVGNNSLISLMQQEGYRITQATLKGFSD